MTLRIMFRMLWIYFLVIKIYAGIVLLDSGLTEVRQTLSSISECEIQYDLYNCTVLDRFDFYYQPCKIWDGCRSQAVGPLYLEEYSWQFCGQIS